MNTENSTNKPNETVESTVKDATVSSERFATLIAGYAYTGSDTTTAVAGRQLRKRYREPTSGNDTAVTSKKTTTTSRKKVVTTTVASPRRSKGKSTGYSAPSAYAHLSTVSDHLAYGMRVLFVGINPGVASSANQHHYANKTNAFWPCLSASGFVSETVTCVDDQRLPRDFRLGLTNLVARPSRSSSEIRPAEFRAGRPVLDAKIRQWRPHFVCFIGKGIFEHWAGRACDTLGLQPEKIEFTNEDKEDNSSSSSSSSSSSNGSIAISAVPTTTALRPDEAIFTDLGNYVDKQALSPDLIAKIERRQYAFTYCMPSSSGLAANYSREEKTQYFRNLYDLVVTEEKQECI